MADKGLVVRDPKTLTRQDRTDRIRDLMDDIIENDIRDVRLKRFMYKNDEELKAAKLSPQQIAKVRAWETRKADAPMGLIAAHERVMARIRKDEANKSIQLNVMNMSIQLPQKQEDEQEPVVIDVEPSK